MKYNIVLIPVDKQNKTELINLANTVILESELPKTNYQINNETSLPHISVFQFELSETDEKKRHEILKKVENITRGVWEKLFQSEKLITIQFEKEINCKYTQQGIFAGTTWVELLIDKSKHPLLQKFHEALINKLKEIDLSPANASRVDYTPHLTLFNYHSNEKRRNFLDEFPKQHQSLLRNLAFIPALGVANNQWELEVGLFDITQPIYIENIENLINEKYHRVKKNTEIKNLIINQLWWVQQNTQYTPQADVLYKKESQWQKHLNREIFRALSRIENMFLLLEAKNQTDKSQIKVLYEEFIQDQQSDKLSFESFKELTIFFKELDDSIIDSQIRASLIAAVTLSPQAKWHARKEFKLDSWFYDSVQFSGHTVTHKPEMYLASSTDWKVISLLKACFSDDTRHWRHAFFMENSQALRALEKQIKANPKSDQLRKSVKNWINYWMINTLGFEGHIGSLTGSRFMTESVYKRAKILNNLILRLFDELDLDINQTYANECMIALGISEENKNTNLFIIRTLLMANLYTPKSARAILDYIASSTQRLPIIEKHAKIYESTIATYIPAFLQNICHQSGSENKMANLIGGMKWIITILDSIQKPNIPISFRLINASVIEKLLKSDFSLSYELSKQGEIVLKAESATLMAENKTERIMTIAKKQ